METSNGLPHKRCARCHEVKSIIDFPERKLNTGRRHSHCRKCKSDYQRSWYERNAVRHKAEVRRHRVQRIAANRAILISAKDVPCADCGGRYPAYVMDLDHVRGMKRGNVSEMVAAVTEAVLRAEIAKCDVVCANCHRLRTYGQADHANWTYDLEAVIVPRGHEAEQLDLGSNADRSIERV